MNPITVSSLPPIGRPLTGRPSEAWQDDPTPPRIALTSSGKPPLYLIEADISKQRVLLWNQQTRELGYWALATLLALEYGNDGAFVAATLKDKR